MPSLKVIVERAAEARENDHEAKIKKKNQDRSRSMEDLAGICAADLQPSATFYVKVCRRVWTGLTESYLRS